MSESLDPLRVKTGVIQRTVWSFVPPTDMTGTTGHLVAKREGKPHVVLAGDWLDIAAGTFSTTDTSLLDPGKYRVELQAYDVGGELVAISPSEGWENLEVEPNLGTVTP